MTKEKWFKATAKATGKKTIFRYKGKHLPTEKSHKCKTCGGKLNYIGMNINHSNGNKEYWYICTSCYWMWCFTVKRKFWEKMKEKRWKTSETV